MKSGRVIDVSKSSLVSLKAELLRKKEEAEKAKGSSALIRPPPKKKKEEKVNPGVEERKQKDELSQEEVDILQKSREVLEVKAKLYDKLQKGESVQEDLGDSYLVDFKEKLDRVFNQPSSSAQESDRPDAEINPDNFPDDDDDWVDYVDCLGRTKRCLKEDLDLIKKQDEEMKRSLVSGQEEASGETSTAATDDSEKVEMISNDMEREMMRQKWEQQEQLLASKKNIYYEDIRFDEARTHGVAYYAFSTDENKREEEQAELKRQRDETEAKQREARQARERRDQVKQARLMAARQRQRARLGLPPLTTEVSETAVKEKEEEREEELDEEDTDTVELEAALARAAHVRPWDLGKDGVKSKTVMTQEEWVAKMRDERPKEFAPPPVEEESFVRRKGKKKKGNTGASLFSGKRKYEEEPEEDMPGPWPQPGWKPDSSGQSEERMESDRAGPSFIPPKRSTGAAIPPPPTFEYYNPNGRPKSKYPLAKSAGDMAESIEAGLQFLKKQAEKREKILEKKGDL